MGMKSTGTVVSVDDALTRREPTTVTVSTTAGSSFLGAVATLWANAVGMAVAPYRAISTARRIARQGMDVVLRVGTFMSGFPIFGYDYF